MGTHAEPLPITRSATARFTDDRRRDRLIAAIAEVAAAEGYGATTVSKVVAAAGVSRNSFYEYFANREECFLAAYDAAVERAMGRVRAASDAQTSRRAAIEAGFAAFLGFAADEPALAWLCVVEVLAAGPRALARRDAALRAFGAFLDESRAVGDGARVPQMLTEVVVGGIYEVIYTRILAHETTTLPGLLPDILYVWFAPFVGIAEATEMRAATALRMAHANGGWVIEPLVLARSTGT